jgi:hypothetical protein
LGIGDWGLGIGPNPQSPIPNPQSPIPNPHFKAKIFQKNNINLIYFYLIFNHYKINIEISAENKIYHNFSVLGSLSS